VLIDVALKACDTEEKILATAASFIRRIMPEAHNELM